MTVPGTVTLDSLHADQYERRALELAWRSCRSGTVGVGALLVDGDGSIMAEGNNAIFGEPDAGPLSGSRVAHAEMNVFAQIPGHVRPRQATLYTSLEPCAMCAGAVIIHGLKGLHILVDDPIMHGLEEIGGDNDFIKRRWPNRTFSDDEQVQKLAQLFAAYRYFAEFDERHHYVAEMTAAKPDFAQWLNGVIAGGAMATLVGDQASLDDVIGAVL